MAGTESVLWQLMTEPTGTRRVVVDLTATDRISGQAGELLAEMSRRYMVDGRTLEFVDPQELLVGAPDVARVI